MTRIKMLGAAGLTQPVCWELGSPDREALAGHRSRRSGAVLWRLEPTDTELIFVLRKSGHAAAEVAPA